MDRLVAVVSWLVDGEHPRLHARPTEEKKKKRIRVSRTEVRKLEEKKAAKAMPARKNVVEWQNDWQ